jgi:hypothetical protein
MAVIRHKQVFSSNVQSVGYDDASGDLHVVYTNGRTAVHQGVPPDVAAKVTSAASVGSALHEHIRGKYDFRYV